jgi:hypothetical protein
MRQDFWKFYESWKGKADVIFVADCGSPLEAAFFRDCVLDDVENRKWAAPYPLHELGTLLLARSKDPIGTYPRLDAECPPHHPVKDALQSARLFAENLSI